MAANPGTPVMTGGLTGAVAVGAVLSEADGVETGGEEVTG